MDLNSTKHTNTPKPLGIALVAHDACKQNLLDWADCNKNQLVQHPIFATGTTGRLLREKLDLNVTLLHSGPLGGDQQIGAKIVERELGVLIFFWDPLESQPHDPDVRALLRLAVLWNIPIANNRATADLFVASGLLRTNLVQPNIELPALSSKACLPSISITQPYEKEFLTRKKPRPVRPKIKSSKKKTGRLIRA